MGAYFYQIVLLIKRLLLALLLFFVARLFFYLFNFRLYSQIPVDELVRIFIIGMRFDLSTIIYFNLLFILPHLMPLGEKWLTLPLQRTLKIYFVAMNVFLMVANMADSIYFHFVQKRSTADVWKFIIMSDDVKVLLPGFIIDYWYVTVLAVVFVFVVWWLYPDGHKSTLARFTRKDTMRPRWLNISSKILTPFLLLGLALIAARGGLQLRPLAIMHASKAVPAAHMPLVLNSVFTAMTTYGHDEVVPVDYMPAVDANKIYSVVHSFGQQGEPNPRNVVVLLLESFSREYVGFLNGYRGFTPFLDSLAQHALVYDSAFSNGLRSIDAIPAIVIGLPALMDDPFITSVYSTNKTRGLAQILNDHGYTSAFFHGGTNGTMDFDGFAGYAGFDHYYGRNEYNNDEDYDGFWGIYDEPFLQFVAQKLNAFPEPFFAFEFTLSSHYPYHIPEKHKSRFPEGDLRIHRVVRYTDYALAEFFKTAAQMPWYKNTLFVIVADHPAQSVMVSEKEKVEARGESLSKRHSDFYKNTSGRYAIPMMLFAPGDSAMVAVDSRTAQQTDLAPTILDYLNVKDTVVAFGHSLLNPEAPRLAVQSVSGLMQITSGKYSLLFDKENATALFDNMADPEHKHDLLIQQPMLADSLGQQLKALYQQYTERLINNKLEEAAMIE